MLMNFAVYQDKAVSTFKPGELIDLYDSRLCNWALGVTNEAGELAGLIKHQVFHKQEVSTMEIAKEVGDVLWYLSALCQTMGISLQHCAELNIAKLTHRHGQQFSFEGSADRRRLEERFEDTEEYKELRRLIMDE